jgi:hypothetical protein
VQLYEQNIISMGHKHVMFAFNFGVEKWQSCFKTIWTKRSAALCGFNFVLLRQHIIWYLHYNYQPASVPVATGLRCGSAASRLLGLWIRILPVAWMSVSCDAVCCQVHFSVSGWSLVEKSPTECVVCVCVCVWSWSLDNEQVLSC